MVNQVQELGGLPDKSVNDNQDRLVLTKFVNGQYDYNTATISSLISFIESEIDIPDSDLPEDLVFQDDLTPINDLINGINDDINNINTVTIPGIIDGYNEAVQAVEDILNLAPDNADQFSAIIQNNEQIFSVVAALNEDAELSEFSSISQLSDSITSVVATLNDDPEGDNQYSSIKQTSESITSTVAILSGPADSVEQFSSIKQTADEINSVVGQLEEDADHISQYSSIKQNAEEIQSTVVKLNEEADAPGQFSSILQNSSSIQSVVANLNEDADVVTYSSISQLANQIVLKVNNNNQIALIDLHADAEQGSVITISTDNLDINAIVTIGGIATESWVQDQLQAGGEGNQVIRSETAPTERPGGDALVEGDLWVDTSNNENPHSWSGTAWLRLFTEIDGGDITTGTITAAKISIGSVTELDSDAALVADIITNYGELDGLPTLGDVSELNNITSTFIENGAIITAKIAVGAIISDRIAANAVTANKISIGSVNDIDPDAALVSDIITDYGELNGLPTLGNVSELNSISSTFIDNGAIITSKIAAGAVVADKIDVNDLNALDATIANFTINSNNVGKEGTNLFITMGGNSESQSLPESEGFYVGSDFDTNFAAMAIKSDDSGQFYMGGASGFLTSTSTEIWMGHDPDTFNGPRWDGLGFYLQVDGEEIINISEDAQILRNLEVENIDVVNFISIKDGFSSAGNDNLGLFLSAQAIDLNTASGDISSPSELNLYVGSTQISIDQNFIELYNLPDSEPADWISNVTGENVGRLWRDGDVLKIKMAD